MDSVRDNNGLDRLKNLHIHVCHVCHGSGIEKYQYQFMVRDRNCESCDGEGSILKIINGGHDDNENEKTNSVVTTEADIEDEHEDIPTLI